MSPAGTRFEISAAYRHLQHVCVCDAHWELSCVDLIDADWDGRAVRATAPGQGVNADWQRPTLCRAVHVEPLPYSAEGIVAPQLVVQARVADEHHA
ncbi:hypothetical protein LMG29542_07986 [Paraburkholderia humisilvae]|uniref:Uncharacterized protein n=2 Tax=Paraburkholderia humisilvae TaxID=627669 RepID=A0A6J5F6U9_9BURK|nr:hypothetical protein LMG29542_07986 [Paraburkholderia humisilvae]